MNKIKLHLGMKLTLEIKLQIWKPYWRSSLHGKETLLGSLSHIFLPFIENEAMQWFDLMVP